MSMLSTLRSDAAKNRERLIHEARTLFLTEGAGSLEAIARAAGVGIGTLYRHFPTREALVEAVYQRELDALERDAVGLLAKHSGVEAMRLWMDRYADFVATKHAMHDPLRAVLATRSPAVSETRKRINIVVGILIAAGTRDGTLRNDVQPDDVTLSLAGVVLAAATSSDADQARRLLDILMAGLQRRP
ncbi:TetR/AcrR family transcriptional regulator [Beijerinckia sp. L45]|uniref:TetR/AcrR family transcriptional regulator n=1 Tax=Beijerinckia sp. L45 TaxID=1641855 RepID=UPI001AEE23E2|nr:TetR/AcrR family transcriptional regulator [Beijerinckia sp. L45]